ncbi:UxaA family hydrolase [Agrobacterium vitis]|uniref:UxaA family hydrolase n=1 Tax=Agrobacterium vitis TaxID=373 RepID=UPI0015738CC7|nr:altronate dehydratase family protein [Agrobacterium vitis]NSZ19285.1 altronate dehydratase [Agrobacterium vitis]QZO06155.1 altronate dehydratase family protein [Agrobacterium vitis]UJL90478.1 altronate dehydratase [Agrobacterium vitis]
MTVTSVSSPLLRLNMRDNVAVARLTLEPVALPELGGAQLSTRITQGHKVAITALQPGQAIIKYGQIIGFATQPIAVGDHVHTHNMAMGDVELAHEFCVDAQEPVFVSQPATFMGYQRENGEAGTRNYIAIVSSVNCSATVAKAVAQHYAQPGRLDDFATVDGVIALTHAGGCAINTATEGYLYLTRTLAGYATHANVGGVVMIGLGCETNQIPALLAAHGLTESGRFHTLTIQATGGTRKSIEAAIAAIDSMLPSVNALERTPQPVSKLKLALECGGSDGYSGISANPALGYAADLLVRHGGTACLAETPEIYGAEHLLTRRAKSPDVAQKLLERIEWWRDYAARGRAELNNNPSHGNKAGGLTTILEKSLGAVAKGGTTRLNAVYEYAERIVEPGFVFMDTPGYDPIAVTGQVAGGCNVICFTTGRGSVSGFKPAPSLKLATNTPMYERMQEDMDLNCGTIVTGEETVEAVGQRIFEAVIATASGERTVSEIYNYGDNEFVPWQVGAIM